MPQRSKKSKAASARNATNKVKMLFNSETQKNRVSLDDSGTSYIKKIRGNFSV